MKEWRGRWCILGRMSGKGWSTVIGGISRETAELIVREDARLEWDEMIVVPHGKGSTIRERLDYAERLGLSS